MKASKLIIELFKRMREHGDLDVEIHSYGCGGHYNCDPRHEIDTVVLCSGTDCGNYKPHVHIESE
jgi:hypothetical protein